jgi:hypothetical protein
MLIQLISTDNSPVGTVGYTIVPIWVKGFVKNTDKVFVSSVTQ